MTNLNEFVGINAFGERPDGTKMSHDEKFGTVVNAIGLETCLNYVPVDLEKLPALYEEDEHFNNVPLHKWDFMHDAIRSHYRRIGINVTSLSNSVCTLKTAARMYVKGGK